MKKFTNLLIMEFKRFSQYRTDVFIYTMYAIFLPVVLLNVWISVAEARGLDTRYFIQYYFVQIIVNIVISSWHGNYMAQRINNGEIMPFLLKPYQYIWYMIANNLSEKIWKICFSLLALVPLYFLYKEPLSQIHLQDTLSLAVLSLFLASIIKFMISHLIGIAGFWLTNVNALRDLNEVMMFLFSGRLFPIQFIISVIPPVLIFSLPYQYTLGFPIDVILGKRSSEEILIGIGMQLVWVVLFLIAYVILWKKGLQVYGGYGQ